MNRVVHTGRRLAKREKETLKAMGATRTINSGATFGDGDGRIKFTKAMGYYDYRGILVEVKSTDKKQFILKRDILEKAEKQAAANRDMPILVVDFGDRRYVLLAEGDFSDIITYGQENGISGIGE